MEAKNAKLSNLFDALQMNPVAVFHSVKKVTGNGGGSVSKEWPGYKKVERYAKTCQAVRTEEGQALCVSGMFRKYMKKLPTEEKIQILKQATAKFYNDLEKGKVKI